MTSAPEKKEEAATTGQGKTDLDLISKAFQVGIIERQKAFVRESTKQKEQQYHE